MLETSLRVGRRWGGCAAVRAWRSRSTGAPCIVAPRRTSISPASMPRRASPSSCATPTGWSRIGTLTCSLRCSTPPPRGLAASGLHCLESLTTLSKNSETRKFAYTASQIFMQIHMLPAQGAHAGSAGDVGHGLRVPGFRPGLHRQLPRPPPCRPGADPTPFLEPLMKEIWDE